MDINALKKRLGQLQITNNRTSNLWKPSPGTTQVRIVPYKFNKDNPFIELFFHYDLGRKSYLSPMSFGRPDPIEEFSQKLKASGNKEDYRLARKIESKFWGFGKTVYQELLSIIADPDYGDITDSMNGRDITVEFKTAEEVGASFPKTTIRVKPNQTPITEDATLLENLMDNQKDITEIYQEQTYEELTEVLNNWLNPDESEESQEESVTESKASPKEEVKEDVSAAFDDLFNN